MSRRPHLQPARAGGALRARRRLEIRRTAPGDIPAILDIVARAYPDEPPYQPGMLRGQIGAYPEGQFVAVYEGKVVGFAAAFLVQESVAFGRHTWSDVTGGGHAAGHDGAGDWLYGLEVAVEPTFRRLRVGERLNDAQKRLAQEKGLKGVVFGGRAPGYARRRKDYPDALDYFAAVADGKIKDPVARFHLRAGFEPVTLLEDYRPADRASQGMAALMRWRNPDREQDQDPGAAPDGPPAARRDQRIVRVAAVQLQMRAARRLEDLMASVEFFIDVASGYRADFVVFPELFSLALLGGADKRAAPEEAMARLAEQTPQLVARMSAAAVAKKVNVIGGSHPTKTAGGAIRNVAYACLRDGAVIAQDKLHPTPDEREIWRIEGGDSLETFETDCGPAAILICYDSEFPELARRVADQGARLLFVPYATDGRAGHLRVKLCCQARAIENQLYVITAGNVGNLPNVENMDVNYAQSGVYTPCDHAFARDGIAAEASENVEMIATADLDLSALAWARSHGSVRNFRDRRFDLYRVVWGR